MKRMLNKNVSELFHFVGGEKVTGHNPNMRGGCYGLAGNCTRLRGYCIGLWGDCTRLRGDCTRLRGNCTGLSGDLDKCGLTKKDRQRGVDIGDLVK